MDELVKSSSAQQAVVEVAVGIVQNHNHEYLIAQRKSTQHLGGLYEFPGGKIEPGETALEALKRELKEEVGITVTEARLLFRVPHQYPDKTVDLQIFAVSAYENEAQGLEGQPILWVPKQKLQNYPFPEANQIIIKLLALSKD